MVAAKTYSIGSGKQLAPQHLIQLPIAIRIGVIERIEAFFAQPVSIRLHSGKIHLFNQPTGIANEHRLDGRLCTALPALTRIGNCPISHAIGGTAGAMG